MCRCFCPEGSCSPLSCGIWSPPHFSSRTHSAQVTRLDQLCWLTYAPRTTVFFFKVLISFCNYTPVTMIIRLSPTGTDDGWRQGRSGFARHSNLSVRHSRTRPFVVEQNKLNTLWSIYKAVTKNNWTSTYTKDTHTSWEPEVQVGRQKLRTCGGGSALERSRTIHCSNSLEQTRNMHFLALFNKRP